MLSHGFSNIDRLIAIWQRLNPGVSGATAYSQSLTRSTIIEVQDEIENENSPLFPFLKGPTNTDFWTSQSSWDTQSFGYYYKDYAADLTTPGGDYPDTIRAKINACYPWGEVGRVPQIPSRTATGYPQDLKGIDCLPQRVFIDGKEGVNWPDYPVSKAVHREVVAVANATEAVINTAPPPQIASAVTTAAAIADVDGVQTQSARRPIQYRLPAHRGVNETIRGRRAVTSDPSLSPIVQDGKLRHWQVFVRFEKFTLSGPFQIMFFIGDFPSSSELWSRHKNFIGNIFNFANSSVATCPNCAVQAASGLVITDTIHLTHALLKFVMSGEKVNGVKLETLEPDDVVPFLTRNLHWRILDARNQERSREEIQELKIQVNERLERLPVLEGDGRECEKYASWEAITHGRSGGLNHGENF